ncbi:MAG: bifunctional metallophosphatase/5'-nucleotidase, partial [Erysipelotrichaceae bacterium]|nr:bifunctional metallophosphatase/5'-nucleotidase [Erysipelotrichaceae bacterium]
ESEDNVAYMIAGDLFSGSVIDSEYQGLSTIDLVNLLNPDVATVGNHEVDYGIAHLLFLEKCARFPITNANLFITMNNTHLFTPYVKLHINGIEILVIGILTDEVLAKTKKEKIIGSFIDIDEAVRQIGILCDNYRTANTDITVLLTHIGIEKDRELAAKLNKEWGIDFIIGAHTHTIMDKPEIINDIPIVQAGWGTDQIGRFDIVIEDKKPVSYTWQCVPIDEKTSPADPAMEQLVQSYRNETDRKYKRIVTRFERTLTHPARNQETELGNLYADVLQEDSSFDIMLFGSGTLRKTELGPVVEFQHLMETTPYDDCLWMLSVTGTQLKKMILYVLRDEAWNGHTEFYQVSRGVCIRYSKSTRQLLEFTYNGQDIQDDTLYSIALQDYHFKNFDAFFNVPLEEVKKNRIPRIVATSCNNIFEEYFSTHTRLDAKIEGRIQITD